jgi:hypothetical protein
MIEQRTKFENAISALRDLLSQDVNDEDKFQSWFEEHSIVMDSLNFSSAIPHPSLKAFNGETFIPDFLVQLLNETWEIFELKLPYEKVLKNKDRRNTFYAKVYEYCQQCFEYSEFFADSANRQNFERDNGFSIPSTPRSKLIIGRDNGLNRFELNKKIDQFSNPIDVLTYDDIIRHLEFDKLKVLGKYENVKGLAIHVVAKIEASGAQNSILSFGSNGDSNSLLIFVNDSGQLCYTLKDKNGKEITQTVDKDLSKLEFGKSMYFVFEFGFGADYTICSVEVNGNYGSVMRTEAMDIDIEDLNGNLVIGSNFNGSSDSDFELYEFIVWPKTFTLDTRLGIRKDVIHQFINNTEIPDSRLVFYDNRFMYKNSNVNFDKNPECKESDLVQTKNLNQPGFLTKGVKKGELFIPVFYDQSK